MEDSLSNKIDKKIKRDIARYEREQRFKIRDKDDIETIEEVFDTHTLLTLYDIFNAGIIRRLDGVIGSGKEARVYLGMNDGVFAVKIYLVSTAEFKKRMQYIIGDPRFKSIKKGMRSIVRLWARKEFENLKRAYNNDILVPKPIYLKENILIMEFIGDDKRAPTLNEYDDVTREHYEQMIEIINKLYRAGLIHADLSEFNIFVHNGKLIPFDFGSAVDISHPNADHFLERDINNINRFFTKKGVEVYEVESIMRKVKGYEF